MSGVIRSYLTLPHRLCFESILLRAVASSEVHIQPLSLRRADTQIRSCSCVLIDRGDESKVPTSNVRHLDVPVKRWDSRDVSTRTPNTICSTYNAADKIEQHLRADGHRIWGFVVYRCTYTSDANWDLCIPRIHWAVRKEMDVYNGRDLLQDGCFQLTVITDASTLDGQARRLYVDTLKIGAHT
ncbi:muramidase [Apiospora hydei]|uniref:Muramidase n=1 Tax=Apiospora hydei TaxID=1337664 RepID=A0ABR1VTN1_9PEZI